MIKTKIELNWIAAVEIDFIDLYFQMPMGILYEIVMKSNRSKKIIIKKKWKIEKYESFWDLYGSTQLDWGYVLRFIFSILRFTHPPFGISCYSYWI